ncbi:SDR family oxidoreductase [Archangium primigenium]|uniref:SDR family oxidoreductase n=1 Tax=[Archangium] primigenium TaxID=2792470 RepID=UPI001958D18F|nr:SDR family oxidoreductase [Archangium primigenium]MBM7113129.1 SDR family oxidoreductase [Archangium primigenium]
MARVALITGTSSGIGLDTAVHLAQAGFHTVATLRDPARARALQERARAAGVSLDIQPLDVASDASVSACVRGVLERHGRIDVLVNNAGAGFLGTLEQTSLEALRSVMEVNFFGVWRMTQAVFPVMREAKSGRIITVTSVGGLVGQPFNDAYCAAKFACEGFLESLAPVARTLGIHLSNIEPGPVNTEFVTHVKAKISGQPSPGDAHYQPLLERYMAGSAAVYQHAQTGEDIARIIVEAATVPEPHFRYATSDLVRQVAGRKYTDLTGDALVNMMGARLK